MAFPFTSGWYSKDLLIELLIIPSNFTFTIAYLFTLLAAFLTSFYSIRLMMIVMFSRPNFPKTLLPIISDSPFFKTFPLILLCFCAIFIGYGSHQLFLAYGSSFGLFIHPNSLNSLLDSENFDSLLIFLPLTFLFLFNLLWFNSVPSRPVSVFKIGYSRIDKS